MRGTVDSLAVLAIASFVMLALRSHLSIATVGLVLVVPVVVGVVIGGAVPGAVAIVAGVLVYDVLFIPPYGTLSIGRPEDWVALGVYAAVMGLVTRVTNDLWRAEEVARSRTDEADRLLVVSELLVSDRPVPELVELIVTSAAAQFGASSVVLLLPRESDGKLEAVATAGEPLTTDELARLIPEGGTVASFMIGEGRGQDPATTRTIPLVASGRPVGLLAMAGLREPLPSRELLATFANHVALAIERAQLRAENVRMSVLEEVDRLRRVLLGAVSHDLRTPLATIKASSSALLDPGVPLTEAEQRELLEAIEGQIDRLARLVSNLLDVSRIQSGALVPAITEVEVATLVDESLAILGPAASERVEVDLPADLPSVEVDQVLIEEAIVNLVENALRFAPGDSQVVIDATGLGRDASPSRLVTIRVSDAGPGVPAERREEIFDRPARTVAASGRATGGTGLGLSIVKSFVELHSGRAYVEDAPAGGARFCIEIPAAAEAGR
jgi:two-component system sensor histidine kinase KdpD